MLAPWQLPLPVVDRLLVLIARIADAQPFDRCS
jgi:hypothetical protein